MLKEKNTSPTCGYVYTQLPERATLRGAAMIDSMIAFNGVASEAASRGALA